MTTRRRQRPVRLPLRKVVRGLDWTEDHPGSVGPVVPDIGNLYHDDPSIPTLTAPRDAWLDTHKLERSHWRLLSCGHWVNLSRLLAMKDRDPFSKRRLPKFVRCAECVDGAGS